MNSELDEKLKAPITLISYGRSGTSLLQNVFDTHPNVSVAGETADLIFGIWHYINESQHIIPALIENGRAVSWQKRVARGVRAVFGEMFNFPTDYWMQKPISQPFILRTKNMSLDEWFELYWQVLLDIFPQGKYITVLRHPFDVVLSSEEYWGSDQKAVWQGITNFAQCILHRSSKIDYAVNYHELLDNPEEVLKKLFNHLQIVYDPVVLKAFDYIYVPNQKGWKQEKNLFPDKITKKFSRQDEWGKIDISSVEKEISIIRELWKKFGYSLELS